MKCTCGGDSIVLARRGLTRRRQCRVCGARWTTLETRLEKPRAASKKAAKPPKPPKPARAPRRRAAPFDDFEEFE